MNIKIFFDLDGTLFDLYGKEDWLYLLENHLPTAFVGNMLPEINRDELLTIINKLAAIGVDFNVITWLPNNSTGEYNYICSEEKRDWCREHLPFVKSVKCLSYGVSKQSVALGAGRMYLIDDNSQICADWHTGKRRIAKNVDKTFTVINALEEIYRELTT